MKPDARRPRVWQVLILVLLIAALVVAIELGWQVLINGDQ